MQLEIDQEKVTLDKIIPSDSNDFYTIDSDPELISVQGLSAQLAVCDKIKI